MQTKIADCPCPHKKLVVESGLREVVDALQKTIPHDIFNLNDFYVAGGSIYNLWHGTPPKDYDIFCRNKKALKKLVGLLEISGWPFIRTDNAITMGKIQFITKYVGEPEIEVAKFDFMHTCYYYDSQGLHDLFGWEHIRSNKLIFNDGRTRDILNSLTRVPKFVARGMTISQEEMLKIIEAGTKRGVVKAERRAITDRMNRKRFGDSY